MIGLLVRLAVLGSALVLAINVAATWIRALTAPKKPKELSPPDVPASPARDMVEDATRRINALLVDVAALKDTEMWQAANGFSEAVGRLNGAVLSDPERYRTARRYLGQILPAAQEATSKFAALHRNTGDSEAKRQFLELAGELTAAYEQAARDYMKATAAEVLVEAEVLRELLDRARR